MTGTVAAYNGTSTDPSFTSSVYLSSAFVHRVTTIPVQPGAVRLRFYATPLTSGVTYDFVDAWLNRFPAMTSGLGG